jgi:hypothetical protein
VKKKTPADRTEERKRELKKRPLRDLEVKRKTRSVLKGGGRKAGENPLDF